MNWKRTIAWCALIFVAALVIGLLLGNGTASMVGVFISSTTLYCLFLRPIQKSRLAHALAAFLLVEAIDWAIPLLLGASPIHMLSNWDSSARHLGAVFAGYAIAVLSSNNSFKPSPLRGPGDMS